jgi:hypothetical protein
LTPPSTANPNVTSSLFSSSSNPGKRLEIRRSLGFVRPFFPSISFSPSVHHLTSSLLRLLDIVETLLLLIWRHLLHFINIALSSSSDPSSSSAGTFATILPSSVSLRFSQAGPSSDLFSSNGRKGGGREVWERTNEELNPALRKVEGVVELSTEIFGQDARLRTSYLQVLARRLRELEQAVPEDGERR